MDIFQFLLSPYATLQFFEKNWNKIALFIPGNNPHKFSHLFGWNQLNYLLNYHRIQYPNLRFSLDGESLPATPSHQWLERLHQGATLIIDSVHEQVPELEKLVADVREQTGYRSQINLYCSPSDQQGFNCHYDTHDVLILQIDGEKDWFVFPETISFPVTGMRSKDQIPPDMPPYLECRLQPGDLLYIPRGHWHYAITSSNPSQEDYSPSLHLTLGIDCQTGLDWMNWLEKELHSNAQWRESLPVIPSGDRTAVQPYLEQLRDHLVEFLQNPETITRYLDHLNYHNRPPLPFALPQQLGSQIFDFGLETRFIPSTLHPVLMVPIENHQTQVIIGEKQATIKGIPTDVVEKLFRPEGFSLLDLADWCPSLDVETGVIPLLTRLVTQGILFVESSSSIQG